MRALLLLATCFLTACTVDADYAGAEFKCSSSEPCPSGQDCMNGLCRAASDNDGSVADASEQDPDAANIECLATIALSDDFEDPEIDPQWDSPTEQMPATVAEELGHLVLTPSAETNPPRYAWYRSAASYAFDARRVFVEFPQMLNTAEAARAQLHLVNSDGDYFFIEQQALALRFGVSVGASSVNIASDSYEAGAHRYWQFRVLDGTLHADTSSDGTTWVNFGSTSIEDIGSDLYLEIRAGTDGSVSDPGQLHADNVNVGGDCE